MFFKIMFFGSQLFLNIEVFLKIKKVENPYRLIFSFLYISSISFDSLITIQFDNK